MVDEKQVDDLDGSPGADACDIRDEVNVAAKVIKSLIGASVRKAYRESEDKAIWDQFKADDDIDRAVRGVVSILTRAFAQEEQGDEEVRLVPLLDMLQHADEPNIHVAEVDQGDAQRASSPRGEPSPRTRSC